MDLWAVEREGGRGTDISSPMRSTSAWTSAAPASVRVPVDDSMNVEGGL
jgi:hypothetical protein